MVIERETQEQLTNIQLELVDLDERLEFAERRTQAIRHQNFVDNFLSGLTDLGTLGFISSHLDWKHVVSPPNPDSGFQRIFADVDNSGHLTSRNSSGTEIDLEYLDSDAIAAIEGEATLDLTGDVKVVSSGKFFEAADFRLDSATELTISTGDVAITQSYHRIDTQSDDATDNLDGMTGGNDGAILIIRPENDARTVVVRHNQNAANAKNILLAGGSSATLDDIEDYVLFIYDVNLDTNGAWIELSRNIGGGYTDAEAIAAVEGESTLALSGAVEITGILTVDTINERTGAAGVTIDSVIVRDGSIEVVRGVDTISSDEITSPTGGYIIAAAETGLTDDLDGIGGGANGRIIVVRADAGDTITVKHNDAGGGSGRKIFTNNNGNVVLTGNDEDSLTFVYDASLDSGNGAWFEISRGEGAAGSADVATDPIWDAKGDLAVGTGSNTAARLAVGAQGEALIADAGETTGTRWMDITHLEVVI